MSDFNYINRHDCPALGKNSIIPRALMSDSTHTYVLYYQYKCPFCSMTSGEKMLGKGVTETNKGYAVDITIAEKLHE